MKAFLGIAVVVLAAGLAPITSTQAQENDVYTFDPKTDSILSVCFATLEVDCTTCPSSECPVPDLGGSDRVEKLTMYDIAPSSCGEYLLDGERPFIVYNYLNIWGSEHYWYRDDNGDWADGYFWQYGHCILAKEGESHRNLTWRIHKALTKLKADFDDEIDDAGYPSDLADALSDANRNATIGLVGPSFSAALRIRLPFQLFATITATQRTTPKTNELFDEGDDANADFSEAVKNLR